MSCKYGAKILCDLSFYMFPMSENRKMGPNYSINIQCRTFPMPVMAELKCKRILISIKLVLINAEVAYLSRGTSATIQDLYH